MMRKGRRMLCLLLADRRERVRSAIARSGFAALARAQFGVADLAQLAVVVAFAVAFNNCRGSL